MSHDPTWIGLGRGLLVLAAVWWAWTGYAWLTNHLEPEEGLVRAGMFAAMAAMLVVALAVPGSFGDEALVFGVAFLLVRVINLLLYVVAARRDRDLLRPIVRLFPPAGIGALLILAAAFADGAAQTVLWIVALLMLYGSALVARGQGWHISPAHFAERYGLIVIIALGESVISLGVAASGLRLTAGIVTAAVLGIAVIAALWWAYFDVYSVLAQGQLEETSGAERARLARDYYSYLHMPMIAGVVLFALGLEVSIRHLDDPLDAIPAVALCGGLAAYFLAHVVLRLRLVYFVRHTTTDRPAWIGPGRLVAGVAMLALIPVALAVPALLSVALVTAVCWGLIAWDVLHYRSERGQVRQARP